MPDSFQHYPREDFPGPLSDRFSIVAIGRSWEALVGLQYLGISAGAAITLLIKFQNVNEIYRVVVLETLFNSTHLANLSSILVGLPATSIPNNCNTCCTQTVLGPPTGGSPESRYPPQAKCIRTTGMGLLSVLHNYHVLKPLPTLVAS